MKTALIGLLMLVSGICYTQNWIDLANVYFRASPDNKIPYGIGGERDYHVIGADFKLPVVLNDQNVLIFGYDYQHFIIKSEPFGYTDHNFASNTLQLGWEHKWNDQSKMMFIFMPRLNTDYHRIDIHHFQLGGLALGTTNRSEDFEWKYGLYCNGEQFGLMFVPLFGFNWKISEQLRLKMLVPINLEFAYYPKNWFRCGLRFDGVNASYRAQEIPGLSESDYYIDRADNNAWLFSEFKMFNNFWIHFKAGHSVLRKYRSFLPGDKMFLKLGPVNILDDRNNDDPKSVPIWFSNGWSFEARLTYRLPL